MDELDLTPEQALEVLKNSDGGLLAQVQDDIEDPDSLPDYLQYDDSEDPEMPEEALNESVNSHRRFLREDRIMIKPLMMQYLKSKHWDLSEASLDDFLDSPFADEKRDAWSSPSEMPNTKRKWEQVIIDLKSKGFIDEDAVEGGSEDDIPAGPAYQVSAETQKLLDAYADADSAVLSAGESAEEKYGMLYNVVANVLEGKSFKKHAFLCGDAGVGKTYSVLQCVKDLWDGSPLKTKGYTIDYESGSIGTAMSPIVAFFYQHRNKEIIILDDCDGFLQKADPDVINLFKSMLDSDNTVAHPRDIMIPATIRKTAGKFVKDNMKEGIEFSYDKKLLREANVLKLLVNGNEVFNESVDEDTKEIFLGKPSQRVRESRTTDFTNDIFGNYHRITENIVKDVADFVDSEGVTEREACEELGIPYSDYQEAVAAGPDYVENEDLSEGLPATFQFTSRLVMISNIAPNTVDEAFKSRCDVVALTLTHDEFVARLGQIVGGMMLNTESELPRELVVPIRDLAYGYLKAAIEIEKSGQPIFGGKIDIRLPLQFRLIPELSGMWLASAQNYCRMNGIKLSPKTIPLVDTAIQRKFIQRSLIPKLQETEYEGDPNKRRRGRH